jgi:hypothetical protein
LPARRSGAILAQLGVEKRSEGRQGRNSMRRRIPAAVMLAGCALVAVTWPAEAQINPFRGMELDLPREDLTRLNEASASLTAEGAAAGDVAVWTNAETGNSGTVELLELFEVDGLPCQRIRHHVELRTRADPVILELGRCRLPDGTWRLR